MQRRVIGWLLTTGLLVAAVAFADSTNRSMATGYIEKFEVPERDEDGNLRWKLMGEKARIREDGLMSIFNARAEFYTSNVVQMVFTSPTCTLDQGKRHATTDAPVRIESGTMVVTGNGADWTSDENSFVIRSNVHVVIKGQASGPAAALPAKEEPVNAAVH